MPRISKETQALQDALEVVRRIKKLPLDINNIADELNRLSKETAKGGQELDTNIRWDILQFAKEADQFLYKESHGDKQLSGSKTKAVYHSKVFKCLGDYESCRKAYGATLCSALCIICIGQQLVPFAPK
jgi:hypothetical protein